MNKTEQKVLENLKLALDIDCRPILALKIESIGKPDSSGYSPARAKGFRPFTDSEIEMIAKYYNKKREEKL